TASGCWIYAGVYPESDRNRAKERRIVDNRVQPNWGFAWPANRRILYNRASGMAALAGTQPFIMKPDGVGWLYAPALKDGPLPTHYEPIESPLGNSLY